MKHASKRVAAFLCGILLLAGCGQSGGQSAVEAAAQGVARPLNTTSPANQKQLAQLAHSANDFSFRLFAQARPDTPENLVLSPSTLFLSLCMLTDTLDETAHASSYKEALGLPAGISTASLHSGASCMVDALMQNDTRSTMTNWLLVDAGQDVSGYFAQAFRDYYRGEVLLVDAAKEHAVQEVVRLLEAQGGDAGMLEALEQPFLCVSLDAFRFFAAWEAPFLQSNTKGGTFRGAQSAQPARFMVTNASLPYFENELLQAVRLGLESGGGLYVLLFHQEAPVSLTGQGFLEICGNMQATQVALRLPRFSIDTALDAAPALTRMGFPLLFTSPPLIENLLVNKSACLDQAITGASLCVEEAGINVEPPLETAAIALEDAPGAIAMVCDRPFVFVITRPVGGVEQVLFIGDVHTL